MRICTTASLRCKLAAILILLLLWQGLSLWVGREIFLPSPAATLSALFLLVKTGSFWLTVGNSALKIALGLLMATVIGTLLAVLSQLNALLAELIRMLMRIIKAVPVASFVILVLLWVRSASLSIWVSFLVALPIFFFNVSEGIGRTDVKLLEMAQVFRMSFGRKIRYVYLPAVMPSFVTACSVAIGFAIKSGVAAEVIGLPKLSVGTALYEAKLYLMTPELFAWTIAIVALCGGAEALAMALLRGRLSSRKTNN